LWGWLVAEKNLLEIEEALSKKMGRSEALQVADLELILIYNSAKLGINEVIGSMTWKCSFITAFYGKSVDNNRGSYRRWQVDMK
jgi:hypothetical protein